MEMANTEQETAAMGLFTNYNHEKTRINAGLCVAFVL